MFERERLLQQPPRSIALSTRLGRPIPNYVAPEPPQNRKGQYNLLRESVGIRWEHRKPPCGFYNCMGHVFATRRTAIEDKDESEWEKIRADDGYRELLAGEDPRLGDIVVYSDPGGKGILHFGEVIRIDRIDASGSRGNPIIRVLSKWDDSYGEDIHLLDDVGHLKAQAPNLKVAIWTDRPPPQLALDFDS